MINKTNLRRKSKTLLIWLLLYAFLFLIGADEDNLKSELASIAFFEFDILLVYYILYLFILPKFWTNKKLTATFWTILALIIFIIIDACVAFIIMPFIRGEEIELFIPQKDYPLGLTVYFILILIYAIANYLGTNNIRVVKEQNKKEQSLLAKELNFYKQQLDPDIFFDFLDYCYQSTKNEVYKASKAIGFFSNMLHYTFGKNSNEKVRLTDEINYLNDFISLQKLLSSKVYVKFNYSQYNQDITILPGILITFVENAFKHGQFNELQYPIQINMAVNNNQLFFTVNNKIGNKKIKASTGTGLSNMKQMLQLFYPGNHELKTEVQKEHYHCELTLNL